MRLIDTFFFFWHELLEMSQKIGSFDSHIWRTGQEIVQAGRVQSKRKNLLNIPVMSGALGGKHVQEAGHTFECVFVYSTRHMRLLYFIGFKLTSSSSKWIAAVVAECYHSAFYPNQCICISRIDSGNVSIFGIPFFYLRYDKMQQQDTKTHSSKK